MLLGDYADPFIAVTDDCPAQAACIAAKAGTGHTGKGAGSLAKSKMGEVLVPLPCYNIHAPAYGSA